MQVEKDFAGTTDTWKRKPQFTSVVMSNSDAITGEVATDNEIYRYVSAGTKRHFIAPKRARALRFQTNYTAKTNTYSLKSSSGGASGQTVFSKGHFVSGIKAREFDKKVKDKNAKYFAKVMYDGLMKILEELE